MANKIPNDIIDAFEAGDYRTARRLAAKVDAKTLWDLTLDPMIVYVGIGGTLLYLLGWVAVL